MALDAQPSIIARQCRRWAIAGLLMTWSSLAEFHMTPCANGFQCCLLFAVHPEPRRVCRARCVHLSSETFSFGKSRRRTANTTKDKRRVHAVDGVWEPKTLQTVARKLFTIFHNSMTFIAIKKGWNHTIVANKAPPDDGHER